MVQMLIDKFNILNRNIIPLDSILLRDYFRSLGLACVIGSFSGFFLKSHDKHQAISLCILMVMGLIFSYFGLREENNHD